MINSSKLLSRMSVSFKKPKLFMRHQGQPPANETSLNKRKNRLSFEESEPKRIFMGQQQQGQETEDIHAARLAEALRVQSKDTEEGDERVFRFSFLKKNDFKQLELRDLNYLSINNDDHIDNCETLKHNLDHIVHHPGIYPIEEVNKLLKTDEEKDFLRNIYSQDDLIMDRFDNYLPPSYDKELWNYAKVEKMKFIMSSSTIGSFLCQIYYAISGFKNPYFEQVFCLHEDEPRKYMVSQRKPISNYVHKMKTDDGYSFYAMDNDKGLFNVSNILMNVGKIVERQLTQKKDEFELLFRKDSIPPQHMLPLVDHHRYLKLNNEILLRSQIDCFSWRKQENGTLKPFVFEIKSRAACPIRYDYPNCMDYTDYEILHARGLHSSYEREYYDLIRGAFLKWAFQIRIGRMEGAFVAYHNIRQVQGFEYITANEIDRRVFGTPYYAETILSIGSRLMTTILNELFDVHLKNEEWESLKIGTYASSQNRKLILFVELFKYREDIQKYKVVNQTDEIYNEYDYFEKVTPLVNKVLKFEVLLYIEINGVHQTEPTIPFKQGDIINVMYQMRPNGPAQYGDYMNFLHDCYKFEEVNLDLNYAGAWVKSQAQ